MRFFLKVSTKRKSILEIQLLQSQRNINPADWVSIHVHDALNSCCFDSYLLINDTCDCFKCRCPEAWQVEEEEKSFDCEDVKHSDWIREPVGR